MTEADLGYGEIEGSHLPHGKWEEASSESVFGDNEVPLIHDSDKEERLLAISTFEEALILWNQWRPQFHEKNIGDIVMEHLNLSQAFPDPSIGSRLKAWIKPFKKIYFIKKTISKLQAEFGTYGDDRATESSIISYEPRKVIQDNGFKNKTGIKGDITVNEYVDVVANSAPRVVYRWATLDGLEDDNTQRWTEMNVEERFGRLIPGIFYGEAWAESRYVIHNEPY